jgi:hypothetical protein
MVFQTKAFAPSKKHLTHLFSHCIHLSHFTASWNEGATITLPSPVRILNFRKIYVLLASCPRWKTIRENYCKEVQMHAEERYFLNLRQFGFRARHSITLQRMRTMVHVTIISIAIFLRLRCSWITKKPLTQLAPRRAI